MCTSAMGLVVDTLRSSRRTHRSVPLMVIEDQKCDNAALCIVIISSGVVGSACVGAVCFRAYKIVGTDGVTKLKAASGIVIHWHIIRHGSGPRENKQKGDSWRLNRSVVYECQLIVKLF